MASDDTTRNDPPRRCGGCNGTTRCTWCRGTGRRGYPGYGSLENHPDPCPYCDASGVCQTCRGMGA